MIFSVLIALTAGVRAEEPGAQGLAGLTQLRNAPFATLGATEASGESAGSDLDAIGEAMANPLSYLWLLFMQNDIIWYEGDTLDRLDKDPKPQNTFLLNPVLSIQLTEKWKAIMRPVIPINTFTTVSSFRTRESMITCST